MQLLVSLRSASEVDAALAGGADIIDAKEPGRGSLGAVSAPVLAEILGRLPGDQALSIAMGDLAHPSDVLAAITSRSLTPRLAPLYLKLGFAGVTARSHLESMVETAVAAAERHPASPRIVVVAYADSARAGTRDPETLSGIAAARGAAGVLLDTWGKDGRGLFRWMDLPALELWVERAKDAGLLTALAGELKLEDLGMISVADPDVVGVRGAACDGGRGGRINASRVRALREMVGRNSGFVQGGSLSEWRTGGETRDPGAISRPDKAL